jgi:hypothetical protein
MNESLMAVLRNNPRCRSCDNPATEFKTDVNATKFTSLTCDTCGRQEPRNLRQDVRHKLTVPNGVPSRSSRNTTIKQQPIGRQTIDFLDQANIDYRDHSHNYGSLVATRC